jgi:protein TonB
MAKIDLYSPQWVEMIFEGRNKEYGAYQLRRSIGKRNVWAIVIMLVAAVIIGSLIGINQIVEAQRAHEAYLAEMRASQLAEEQAKKEAAKKKDEPKPKVEEIKEEQVPEVRKTIQFTAPVIKPDEQVKNQIDLTQIKKAMDEGAAAGAQTQEGSTDRSNMDSKLTQTEAPIKIETPKPEVKQEVEQVVESKPLTIAEKMPSFKGNVNAWLGSHIQYPAAALENGIQGRVVIKFVVGKDGSVSQAQVVRGVDPSLDKEALRVVNAMPKWNPGMNNGQPAAVWYTLPVQFRLAN